MSNASLDHPAIGTVTGNLRNGVAQFLGIKYATLSDAFAPPEVTQYNKTGLQATTFGPQVVNPPGGVDMEMGFIQQTLPKAAHPGSSALNGLNINIGTPEAALRSPHDKKFPVFVFIHGGGFAIGGNWWPQYDTAALVALSVRLGSPIVAVTINYRTGCPGFLTTPELRKNGYKANNGLRDQRAALTWIQQYIDGFGGDAENVTLSGQSAGGVSAGLQLFSDNPLAKRLLLLGGCPPLLGSLPMSAADEIGSAVMRAVGVDEANTVQSLLQVPTADFWQKVPPSLRMGPVIDDDIVPQASTFQTLTSRLAECSWCDSIMLGQSGLDASIFAHMLGPRTTGNIGAAFRKSAAQTLAHHPHSVLQKLLEHYELSESSPGDSDAQLRSILQFANDICFSAPSIELAAHFVGKSYVFCFNEPNPWPGPSQGQASHILDVAFLFQNYNAKLDEKQRAGAVQLATDVVTFVNGKAPWKAFNDGQHGMAIYDNGERSFCQPPVAETIKRDPFIFVFTQQEGDKPTLDELMKVFTDFLSS